MSPIDLEGARDGLETTVRMSIVQSTTIGANMANHQVEMPIGSLTIGARLVVFPEDPRMVCSPHLREHTLYHVITLISSDRRGWVQRNVMTGHSSA